MKLIETLLLKREAKRLRERMSKLGYFRPTILAVLRLYDVQLKDMGDCAKLGTIY